MYLSVYADSEKNYKNCIPIPIYLGQDNEVYVSEPSMKPIHHFPTLVCTEAVSTFVEKMMS